MVINSDAGHTFADRFDLISLISKDQKEWRSAYYSSPFVAKDDWEHTLILSGLKVLLQTSVIRSRHTSGSWPLRVYSSVWHTPVIDHQ